MDLKPNNIPATSPLINLQPEDDELSGSPLLQFQPMTLKKTQSHQTSQTSGKSSGAKSRESAMSKHASQPIAKK